MDISISRAFFIGFIFLGVLSIVLLIYNIASLGWPVSSPDIGTTGSLLILVFTLILIAVVGFITYKRNRINVPIAKIKK